MIEPDLGLFEALALLAVKVQEQPKSESIHQTIIKNQSIRALHLLQKFINWVTADEYDLYSYTTEEVVGAAIDKLLDLDVHQILGQQNYQSVIVRDKRFISSPTIQKWPAFTPCLFEQPKQEFNVDFSLLSSILPNENKTIVSIQNPRAILKKLMKFKILYCSIETHTVHSYHPIICLLSIMTPMSHIYIFDGLSLRSCLTELFSLFTNNNICKVFFDAKSSFQYFRQSFGFYPTQVFDITTSLNLVGMDANFKKIITPKISEIKDVVVDWRINPITQELALIASTKLIYLPQIAQSLCKELPAIALSQANKQFNHFSDTPTESNDIIKFSGLDLELVATVLSWRDSKAQEENESVQYILPDKYIIQILQSLSGPKSILIQQTPSLAHQKYLEIHHMNK